MNHDDLTFLISMVLLGLFAIVVLINPVGAYTVVYQGDTITLGETYDMRSVYGWTGELGWWEIRYKEGSKWDPDIIVDLNDYKPHAIYLDPEIWKIGNWYQWDGPLQNSHGNSLMFTINASTKPITPPIKTVLPTPTPVPTIRVIPPSPTPETNITTNQTVVVLPTTQPPPRPTPVILPNPQTTFPKTGISNIVPISALLLVLIYIKWRK